LEEHNIVVFGQKENIDHLTFYLEKARVAQQAGQLNMGLQKLQQLASRQVSPMNAHTRAL
jgi:hypothetical protein